MERLEKSRSHLAQALSATGDLSPLGNFVLVEDHVFPRDGAMMVGVAMGIGIGIGNATLSVVFPSWLAILGLLTLSLAVNTIGAIGDCWISWKVLGHPADTWFQDTKSGTQAWKVEEA